MRRGARWRGEADAGGPGVVGAAAGEGDGDDGEDAGDCEPVGDGPEERRREVAVAVHVGVGVGGGIAEEVERVLPAEVVDDGHDDEDTDDDAVADELVGDDGLYEEREENEDEDLREGDDVELFEVLEELVVVVAGDGLHEDAAEGRDGEKDELDEAEGEELGEPVGGFADGQRVVDAVEVGVALAPDEFGGVESGDDVEEERGAAFDGLQHEVGDGPDVLSGDAAGEVAVVDGEAGHEDEDAPEGDLTQDVGDADSGEREKLREGGRGAEDLMDDRKPWRRPRAAGRFASAIPVRVLGRRACRCCER